MSRTRRAIIVMVVLLIASVAFSLFAASPQYYSASELAGFNGQSGKSAYVASEGVVYDVTSAKDKRQPWYLPGEDITASANKETKSAIKKQKVTGKLVVEYTEQELHKFSGQNGQPGYVAVDGLVYDVSKIPAWATGMHKGFYAGQDITRFIKGKSPHGVKVLTKLKVVGKLKATEASVVPVAN